MTPERASAAATATAIIFGLMIVAFNLGRIDAASKARQCHTDPAFTIPFKGTLP